MQDIIINLMNDFGYIAIFLLVAIENIFPPIPSEVILTFSGYMSTYSGINVVGIIIVSTLGSLVGAIILYYIGKLLNIDRLIKLTSGKLGKVLRLKKQDIIKADKWFDTKGYKSVLFCRFIPIVRSLISIPAGICGMNMPKFLVYTTIGSLIWNSALTILGSIVGENWQKIALIFDAYSIFILVALLIIFVVFVIWFYKRKKKVK